MIKDHFKLAIKNLRKRKLRTFLTLIGIFISIATIFILVSLSLGLQATVEEQFNLLGADKFFIIPKGGFLSPPGSFSKIILTEEDVGTVKKTKGVKDYSYGVIGNVKVEFSNQAKYTMVIGLPLDHVEAYTESGGWGTLEGRGLREGDTGKVTIGYLFKYGDIFSKPVEVGDKITINDERFKVEAIAKQIGNSGDDSIILMPIEDVRRMFDLPDRVDQIVIQIEPGESIKEVSERTEKRLRKLRGVTEDTQDFDVLAPEELLESFQNILAIITAFLAGVAVISLVVGGIGISNTMYTSVIERTREIGVMKAVGARNSDVLFIFLIESGLLGLSGGVIGVGLGFCIGKLIEFIAINNLNTTLLQISVPFYLVAGCLTFSFLIGAVSGLLPAWQASKTNVVDALRYE